MLISWNRMVWKLASLYQSCLEYLLKTLLCSLLDSLCTVRLTHHRPHITSDRTGVCLEGHRESVPVYLSFFVSSSFCLSFCLSVCLSLSPSICQCPVYFKVTLMSKLSGHTSCKESWQFNLCVCVCVRARVWEGATCVWRLWRDSDWMYVRSAKQGQWI